MARKRFIFYCPNPFIFLRRVRQWGIYRHLIWMVLALFVASLTVILPGFSVEPPPIIAQVPSELSDRSPDFWRQEANYYAQNGDFVNQAVALGNLSLALQERGEWEEARESSTQAIQLLEQLSATKERDRILAQSLDIQGKLRFSVGEVSSALGSWQQAGKMYQQLGLTQAEDRNRLNQVQAMQELGLFQPACELLNARIDENVSFCAGGVTDNLQASLSVVSGDRAMVQHLQALGDVLRLKGELEVSETVLKRGLEIAKASDDTMMLDRLHLSMGNTLRARGDRQWAIAQSATSTIQFNFQFCPTLSEQPDYNSALQHYQKVYSNNPLLNLQSHLNQLKLTTALNPAIVDSKLLSDTQSLINQTPNLFNTQFGNNLILNYLQTATCISTIPWQNIAQDLQTIINASEQRKDLKTQSYALGYLGRLYEQHAQDSKEHLQTAKTHTQKALSIAQSLDLNAPELAYQWQWQLGRILEKTQSPRREILSAYKAAFNTLQSLRQELVSSNRDLQFSFRDEIEPVYRKYVDLLLQDNPSQDNLKEARNVIEALQLAELDDFFNDACVTAQESELDDIASDTAVLYPILLDGKIAVIYTLSDTLIDYTIESLSNPQRFERTINALINDLKEDINNNHQRYGKIIYDYIFSDQLKSFLITHDQIKTLVFVLDGQLRNLPMATLYDGEQYLVQKYAIAVAPGLNLLTSDPLDALDLRILTGGLGKQAPSFDFVNARLIPLAHARIELETISQTSQNEVPVVLDENFTLEVIKSYLANSYYSAVHLVTHGQFSSNPEETFILTWDERLRVNQLNELIQSQSSSEPIELLVLSACETAEGDNRAALGLAGVSVRAGSRSTLATLWKVDDRSTAQFMSQFYRELIENKKSKAEALKSVQQSFISGEQGRDRTDPRLWGAFVLIGHWI
ncbi:CHAT domain-containing protein [Roseofilum sp. BLCC_M91]|uniref:CHAT domain-containing protein n=1 Tax=Roseofilum halophilum BLCC-M91 TaxID=3022259 RepID=A0ABT7BHY6_9CYAN|nr:CHAT domain-containing protein [Roseofilum halophilum]MDJ1178799.1 CHAT domain-containing protein [Roseofilum halophilum BLCC-M91]